MRIGEVTVEKGTKKRGRKPAEKKEKVAKIEKTEKAVRNPVLTRKKIINAAEECFAQKGFYGARIDEISQLAQANKRMIYAYYGNKEDLYVEVLTRVYKRMYEIEIVGVDETGDCVEAIKNVIRNNYMFLYNNPNFVKIMLWENLNEAKFAKNISIDTIKQPVYDKIRKILTKGIEQKVFREDISIEDVVFDTIAFSFSYFSNRFTLAEIFRTDYYNESSINKRIEHICDCILKYLCV